MGKFSSVCLMALFVMGSTHAAVIDIDLSNNGAHGPIKNNLAGVVGAATGSANWNQVKNTDLYSSLVDEDGTGTGARFQITGDPVSFGFTTNGDADGFFRTYAFFGNGTEAVTNGFRIGGVASSTVDLYFYATWEWIDAGAEFRVSGDGGATWLDWKLADGVPSEDDAAFSEGNSYVVFSGVNVHSDGTVLGEWMSTTNGASTAYRGMFNAIQVVGDFDAPAPPAFAEDPFTNVYAEATIAYTNSIAGTATGAGLVYSSLTPNSWLSIAPDGTVTGTPTVGDIGMNSFMVQVTDEQARSTNATMVIEVREFVAPVWEFNFEGTGLADAAGARRYTAFATSKAGLGDGTVLAVNSNPSANNNTGPGFFYIPTGLAWQPNTLYTIDFLVGDRTDSGDNAIAEYGLFAGLPADDDGAGDYAAPAVTGAASPWSPSTNASLGIEGQVTIVNLGATMNSKVSDLSGTTASDTAFSFITPNDVSGMGEMIFFVRSGDDGVPNGLRVHADEFKIYTSSAIAAPNAAVLTITGGSGTVMIGAANLTAAGYVVNHLQYKDNLVIDATWINLYSVSGVTETNWTISVSDSPVFYRIESTY